MAMANPPKITVEVAPHPSRFSGPVALKIDSGTRLVDLLDRLNIPREPALCVGIWGRTVDLNRVLEQGDRVEFYRPLAVDPKVARREKLNSGRRRAEPKS